MTMPNTCWDFLNLIVCQDQPTKLPRKGTLGNAGHVIVLESNHFQGSALCELGRKSGEVAVRKERNLEFVETGEVIGETREWIVGEIENFEAVEKGENVQGEGSEVS
jgi:hypothetical protein